MSRVFRVFAVTVLVTVLIVLLGLVAGYLYLRSSLPAYSGTLELPGLRAPVEVVRDRYAIPHIYAQSPEDAYFALGVVHAQERLWQMEFQRRVGAGRLSEVLGPATLDTDRFLRTLGVYRRAEEAFAALEPDTRQALEAYVAGVNAYLTTRRGALPPEFLLLGFEPEPWSPADVLVWAKMMAYDLGGNWEDEVLRARLALRLSRGQLEDLYPGYPDDAPIVLPEFRALYQGIDWAGLFAKRYPSAPPGTGSNNWVVSGAHTVSGAPLLANDPHLDLKAPSLWYLAHLSAPGLEVIGATLPGTPAVLLGRNARLAWGFTNTGPDVQDTFVERLDPEDPTRYLTPEGSEPFVLRREVIHVKGGEDVVMEVRETRHGPVISDVSGAARAVTEETEIEAVVALAWTALEPGDTTLQAVLKMNLAEDWESFVDALRDFVVPQQNIVYADVEGNIGYYAPARVPIRRSGDGRLPVPGWTGAYDWVGYVPFEALPHAFNPPTGVIATANNQVVPDDYPYFLGDDWAEPYRIERIEALLADLGPHTPESFARIQSDQLSLMARTFLPYTKALEPQGELEAELLELLAAWDGTMSPLRPEPLIFASWYREVVRLIAADELGGLFDVWNGFHPLFVADVLAGRTQHDWCDDTSTPARESCDEVLTRALTAGVAALVARYGEDSSRWRWGDAHLAYHDHDVLTNTPLKRLSDLAIANGGDAFTVNAARFDLGDTAHPFRQTSGPGYRAIYDLAEPDNSRFIQASGQSGNLLSPRYRDFLTLWRDVKYLPMRTERLASEQGAIGTLILRPEE